MTVDRTMVFVPRAVPGVRRYPASGPTGAGLASGIEA